MKNTLLLLTILSFMISCNGQEKRPATSLADEPLQLENFDFNTKISILLPENTKSKDYNGYYEIKSEMLELDTITDGDYIGSEKPIRIEYTQQSFSSRDILAKFGSEEFNAISLVTTMNGQIMLVNALIGEIELKQTEKFIEKLDTKYGKSTKTKGEFANLNFDIYTWQLEDRIIRYTTVLDNEENALKIEVNEENKKITEGEKNPHYKGYIFIIKKEFKDEIFGKVSSGDFVFLE